MVFFGLRMSQVTHTGSPSNATHQEGCERAGYEHANPTIGDLRLALIVQKHRRHLEAGYG